MYGRSTCAALVAAIVMSVSVTALASAEQDRKTVAALDIEYQSAVKRNDAVTMARILHEEFTLVLGDGRIQSRSDLLEQARSGMFQYEIQGEIAGTQTVRIWGDTAVVTALLWLKGTKRGVPFDRKLWFSDTYVRTSHGWRYAFAQASLPLPDATVGMD